MEIYRFGFHHAAMLSGCMRPMIRLTPEEQPGSKGSHGRDGPWQLSQAVQEMVTILMFGSRALAEETGLSQGAVMALQLQMLIAAPVPGRRRPERRGLGSRFSCRRGLAARR